MDIIRELKVVPNLSLALGFFDGLHVGHRAVIDGAIEFARNNAYKSAVITFKEHPFCYLKGVPPKYILSHDDKYAILERIGIDYVIELDFNLIRNLSPEEYLKDVLVKYFSPKAISSGFNHHFGENRLGDVKFLSDHQDKYNYIYFATPPQTLYGDIISSTAIRNFVSSGAVDVANEMLGRMFYVKGEVIEGQKLGRKLGFPTINIMYPEKIIQPAYGVYKTVVELENGDVYCGLANFGLRPTVSNSNYPVLEVHIVGFDGNLYGQNVKINFLNMLREEIKFSNLDELKMQISIDMQTFS